MEWQKSETSLSQSSIPYTLLWLQMYAQAWVALTCLYETHSDGFGSAYTILHEYMGLPLTLYTLNGKLIKCRRARYMS